MSRSYDELATWVVQVTIETENRERLARANPDPRKRHDAQEAQALRCAICQEIAELLPAWPDEKGWLARVCAVESAHRAGLGRLAASLAHTYCNDPNAPPDLIERLLEISKEEV